MGRDWDLFALAGLAPLILLVKKFIESGRAKPSYPILIILAFALSFPYLAVNLQREPSISYMSYLLKLDLSKSRSGGIMLRNYLTDCEEYERAEALNTELINQFPIYLWSKQSRMFMDQGRFNEAMQLADSVYRFDPYSADGYDLRGQVHVRLGNYDSALVLFKMATELSPYNCQLRVDVAEASMRLEQLDLMWEQFRIGQKLNPDQYELLRGISRAFYRTGQLDSLIIYGGKLAEAYPDSTQGYLMIGLAYRAAGRFEQAVPFFEKYGSMLPPGQELDNTNQVIEEMKTQLEEITP
jgi:tetratricopeptide (TPR) repeat protein